MRIVAAYVGERTFQTGHPLRGGTWIDLGNAYGLTKRAPA